VCMCVPFFLTTDDSEKERNISTTKRSFPNPALSTYAFFFSQGTLSSRCFVTLSLSLFFFFGNKMEYKKIDSLSLPPILILVRFVYCEKDRFSAALTKESLLTCEETSGFVRQLKSFLTGVGGITQHLTFDVLRTLSINLKTTGEV